MPQISAAITTPPDTIGQAEAAKLMQVSIRTLERYRQSKSGPDWRRLGPRRVVYDRAAVIGWLHGNSAEK